MSAGFFIVLSGWTILRQSLPAKNKGWGCIRRGNCLCFLNLIKCVGHAEAEGVVNGGREKQKEVKICPLALCQLICQPETPLRRSASTKKHYFVVKNI